MLTHPYLYQQRKQELEDHEEQREEFYKKVEEIRECLSRLHEKQKKRAALIIPAKLRPKLCFCSPEYIGVLHDLMKEAFPKKFKER
jgi:predicted transcriptional regulator